LNEDQLPGWLLQEYVQGKMKRKGKSKESSRSRPLDGKNPNGLIPGTPGAGKSFSAKRETTKVLSVCR